MKRFVWLIAYCALFINCSKKVEEAVETKPEKGPVLVEMKPEAQEHVGLKVETATVKQLTEFLQVTGSVQPIDSRVSQVRSLARGRVQEVLTKVGDRVGNNQALVQIDNIEAGELLSQRESARADLQRYQMRLVGIGAAAQKELELAQAEQQGLEQNVRSQESVVNGINSRFRRFGADEGSIRGPVITALRAPFAGVVTKAQAAVGEVVNTNTDLFTIVDLSQVWVQAEVYEKDLGRIRVGQNAFITVDTYPEEKFAGRVAYISDILDAQTRTAKVRCELSNPRVRLKLDMFASVRVPTTFSKQALVSCL